MDWKTDYQTWANYYDAAYPSRFVKNCNASRDRFKKIETVLPNIHHNMAQENVFKSSWPLHTSPRSTDYPYLMNKFCNVKGCNWWLFPCMNQDEPEYIGVFLNGDFTLKFKLGPTYSYTKCNSEDRIGILIESPEHLYHVYVDDEAKLFIDETSNMCIGQLNMMGKLWDGTASLDTDTIHTMYAYTVGKPNDWHHYSEK
jgi:hypothetical protein